MTAPRTAPTHGCLRCGAPVAIDVGLCDRCNPLGLRDSASSQVHGLAIGGVVLFVVILAVVARLALAGIGPFTAEVGPVVPSADGLAISLTVTNTGSNAGQTSCRVSDPADRTGSIGVQLVSPQIGPGETATFIRQVTGLGSTVRPLVVECRSP